MCNTPTHGRARAAGRFLEGLRRMGDVRRIAILGGGMASLTTALELTSTPDWSSRYDVTVYQMGWRLGGKGASSRNPSANGRIEEHGLHVWFGCYENAFRALRACYDELRRPAGSLFATMDEAFTPQNATPYFELVDGHWTVWPLWFPPGPDRPGTGGAMPSDWDYLVMAIEAIVHGAETLLHLTGPPKDDGAPTGVGPPASPHPSILHWLASHVPHPVTSVAEAGLGGLLHVAHSIPRDPAAHEPIHLASLLWLLERAKDWLLGHLTSEAASNSAMRRAVIELDLGLTLVIGCLRDGVPSGGFGVIDDEDARAWFARHGAAPTTVDSTPVRALYDLYLAYQDGDQSRPALAAGVAIHAVLRLALGYKGAVVNEMRAGMGEVVIAPIYQVLAARGVKFAFFHRVERLELTPDRTRLARIHLCRQVELEDGSTTGYRPLQPVDGLPCWPSEPFADQIRNGAALRGVDLESRWSGWVDVDHPVLEADRDFDVAVLGISLGGLRDIADDFRADDRWRDLLDCVGTTQSASAQLWMDSSLADLGWKYGPVPADAAPEPLDVWADRSELLHLEGWPEPGPRSLQYLCGATPGDDYLRPPTDTGVPAAALAEVTSITAAWLSGAGTAIWPGTRSATGDFDWNQLHDPAGRSGPDRLAAQYLRANIDPSERYVLSLPGTTRYRLAADESGYDNLVLAGDWTRTDWNVGCIEAAVSSGINAAAVIEAADRGAPSAGGARSRTELGRGEGDNGRTSVAPRTGQAPFMKQVWRQGTMIGSLSRNWWAFAFRGIVALAIGILAFVEPGITVVALIAVFAAYASFDGVLAVAAGISVGGGPRWLFILGGLMGIAIGLVTINRPDVTAIALVYLIAVWAIATGVAEAAAAWGFRDVLENEWLLVISGVVSMAFGVYLIFEPGDGVLAVLWLIGYYAIFAGIMYLATGLGLRSLHRKLAALEEAMGTVGTAVRGVTGPD